MNPHEKQLQQEFPVKTTRIFFDHAKVSPLPRRVRDAVNAFTNDACENGTKNYKKWMEKVEKVRGKFAWLINGDVDEVAFVKNTSEGISIVANGLDWNPGDNVVIPDIEFPANVYPWLNLKRFGVETRMVKSKDGRVVFDDLIEQTDKRTRIVSVSSVECNSGFKNDLNRIGAFCRENNILFCVDAIQSLGVLEMDVKRDNIDFLSADGHKWMLSVEGLGGFYISKNVLEKIYPVTVGWDSVVDAWDFMNYDFTFRPDAKRFEEGSFNTMSIYALGAALDLLQETGIDSIQSSVLSQGDYLMEGLQKRGIKILNSQVQEERSGIISYELKIESKQFFTYMLGNNVSLTVTPEPQAQSLDQPGILPMIPASSNTSDQKLTPSDPHQYTIQVGAYKTESNANQMVRNLLEKGYRAHISSDMKDGAPLFKVHIEEFSDKKEARKLAEKLTTKENLSSFVTTNSIN